MQVVKVAIALLTDKKKRLLVTRRGSNSTYAGWWEFPGGKLEINETAEQALAREVYEELGVVVQQANYLGELVHTYPEVTVNLLAYHVINYQGTPVCCEQQQDLRWVSRAALGDYQLLDACRPLLTMIEERLGLSVESIDSL